MRRAKELWLPFLILAVPCLIFSWLLPYFPVDETRYLSVAWEMKLHNSFLVPLQNGLPYSHKPPLLFWLINLDWLLFGVNEGTLRFLPTLFSLLNVALVYRIALVLWQEEKIARYAALILCSTFSYLLWSSLIMFDIVLTFWTLLALTGLATAAREHGPRPWLMVGIAIAGGILTKGPVLLVYLLPVALFAFLWIPRENFSRRWYGWLALSLLAGVALVLLWLIPAALTGGDSYRKAILWGQTAHRVANSFAHRRPFWWYLPLLPVLLLPWILVLPSWRGRWRWPEDPGTRFAAIWALSTLVIFSLISGKQAHYLIPALPAFSLLMAKNLVCCEAAGIGSWRYAVPAFYGLVGTVAFALPCTGLAQPLAGTGISGLPALSCGLIALGITMFLAMRRATTSRLVGYTALSALLLGALVFASDSAFFQRYDLHDISSAIRQKQEEGYTVLHQGKYHGQYHFLGRLKEPLVTPGSLEEIGWYAANREKVALVSYEPATRALDPEAIYFQQPFRSKKVVLWNKRGITQLVGAQQGQTEPAR